MLARTTKILILGAIALSGVVSPPIRADQDPPEVRLGERLALETRFSWFAYRHPHQADPVMNWTVTTTGRIKGPFAGRTMNCRACHLVDEQGGARGGGMRTYADFARRSPITRRPDGARTSVRNAMQMVDITVPGHGLFHYDGQFARLDDLVRATLTGRNYGWLPREYGTALHHVATVIREDDGRGALAREFGGSYRKLLTGRDSSIPAGLRLPPAYRVDVEHASDGQIVEAVSRLVAAYVNSLRFGRDAQGRHNSSPYDRFLQKNGLPRRPRAGESALAYSRRLRASVNRLRQVRFVTAADGKFRHHRQPFVFGPVELQGMKIFFAENVSQQEPAAGNCIACHTAPEFSDFGFHNTGVTQLDYDDAHGAGSFAALKIPALAQRMRNYDAWLPPTPRHPDASGRYRAVAARDRPGEADLGLWNVYANPDMPAPQDRLNQLLCARSCKRAAVLNDTIARFKTPVLRDLGDSAPYMHSGRYDTLEQAVDHYPAVAALARAGRLRNGAPELGAVRLRKQDTAVLAAFLRALDEDYE
jgi:cytochrome c peroxidase